MLVTGGKTVKLWDVASYKQCHEVTANNGSTLVGGLAWNKDGKCIANLCDGSPEISIFTVSGSTAVHSKMVRPMDHPKCIQFANLSQKLLGVGGGNSVIVWDIMSNSQMKYYGLKESGLCCMSFSHKDSHIACGTKNGNVYLLSVSNNSISLPINMFSDKSKMSCLEYSKVSRSLIGTSSDNGSIAFLDSNSCKTIHSVSAHVAPVSGISFSPLNSLLFISVGYDKRFVCHNINAKETITTIKTEAPLTSCSFLYNGQQVALGTMTGQLLIHDLRMLTSPIETLEAYNGPVTSTLLQPLSKKTNSRSSNSKQSVGKSVSKSSESSTSGKSYVEETKEIPVQITVSHHTPSKSEATVQDEGSPQLLSPIRSGSVPQLSPLSSPSKYETTDRMAKVNLHQKERTVSTAETFDEILSPIRTPTLPSRRQQTNSDASPFISPYQDDVFLSPLQSISSPREVNNRSGRNSSTNSDILSPIKNNTSSEVCLVQPKDQNNDVNDYDKENVSINNKDISYDTKVTSGVLMERNQQICNMKEIENPINTTTINETNIYTKKKMVSFAPVIVEQDTASTISNESIESTNSVSAENRLRKVEMSCKNMEDILQELHQSLKMDDKQLLNKDQTSTSSNTGQNFQIELVRNCVKDEIDEFRMENNKRFIHLHLVMLNMFYDHKADMEELIKSHSLNQELLQKCEELKEENNRLRNLY